MINLALKMVLPLNQEGETQIGNDITNIEAVRFQLKTQFDRNVVTQFEVQEQIFDYIFSHLSIDTEGSVNHPILITESLLNPNYSRSLMTELLFECYHIPGLCYGIDSIFSYLHNTSRIFDNELFALIVSCGYHCTHVIPIVAGQIDFAKCKRIDIGGYHITYFTHKLLQLKYPAHFNSITLSRAEALIHDHGHIATDYQEEASLWANLEYYQENVKRIQLPYTVVNVAFTPEQQRERRREFAKKLVELNARKRDEKLAEDEEKLNDLLELQSLIDDTDSSRSIRALLSRVNVSSVSELNKTINKLQHRINNVKRKILSSINSEDITAEEPKLKTLKTKIKLPKEDEDLQPWLNDIYRRRKELLEKRSVRRQRRLDMAKRGTAAAQERMRLINQLAKKESRKRDDFGCRDEDWDVYKFINKEGGDTDSEEEQEKLVELEEILRYYDPLFSENCMIEEPVNTKEAYQLHFGLEKLRAPEVIFQPSMIGCTQAGLAETLDTVLRSYPEEIANRLALNIFLTGGSSQIPGFLPRLNKELLEMRPFKSKFNVSIAKNCSLDSWHGTKQFASSNDFTEYLVTVRDYYEYGADFFKEHFASNKYIPTPVLTPQPVIESENV